MTRATRSRQPLGDLNTEPGMRTNAKSTGSEKPAKKRNSRAKSNGELTVQQDENAVPSVAKSVAAEKTAKRNSSRSVVAENETKRNSSRSKASNKTAEQDENTKPAIKGDKKFFKNKDSEKEHKPIVVVKKTLTNNRKKGKATKKVQNDNTFSPEQGENRTSTKAPEKKLRPRATKNYCELSQLAASSAKENPTSAEKPAAENDVKGGPIYKTLRLSQEKAKDSKEVYDFPDDSQEDEQKGKKRKKTVKRPAAKRVKKAAPSFPITQKKTTKKVPLKVQFIEPPKESTNVKPQNTKVQIPEHLQNAGDTTLEEASTIKVISVEKLEGSKKINLTATPPAPKTITSELKLYGPKNAITSKPTTQYSNMVNHSLIRKSMSPIRKLEQNFETGSPWRPVDAFSRVQGVVQSTPQINRLPSREKKLQMRLVHKKSICSEETILLSPVVDDKASRENYTEVISPLKRDVVSPRKFGTVISNLSPVKSVTAQSVNNNSKSPVQNNQLSVRAVSSETVFPDLPDIPVDQEENSIIPVIDATSNSRISPTKKFSTPSPFRLEKLRTSSRIARIDVQSKSVTISSKVNEEPEAGPSWRGSPIKGALRQSNLNNFLNIDEVPQSACISTKHGIFDDVHSTPINGRKPKRLIEDLNVDNAFGFDDGDSETPSTSLIVTEENVKESDKGKVFVGARVKSSVPSRNSQNTVKQTLLKAIANKKPVATPPVGSKVKKIIVKEKKASEEVDSDVAKKTIVKENEKVSKVVDSDVCSSDEDDDMLRKDVENNNEPKPPKEAILDAVSFSDTFDVLSEKGEIEKKIPDEVPLFVDLEPVHFTKPPRRSYNKRKRGVNFDISFDDADSDDEEKAKRKHKKKKKESKQSKEDQKRMAEWVKNVNDTFEEIEHYDLVVE